MRSEEERILETIEIDEKETLLFELRQRVLTATGNESRKIIDELRHREKSHLLGHNLYDNEPYYYFFEAYAHFTLPDQQNEAIDRANRSASLFRIKNSPWNEALVHWFLSLLYEKYDHGEACKELQIATAILERIAGVFQQDGRIADCQSCQAILRQLYRQLVFSRLAEEAIIQNDKKSFLFLPSIPIYQTVEVKNTSTVIDNDQITKREKHVWVEPLQDLATRINILEIEDSWYTIKPVKNFDGQVKLNSKYHWSPSTTWLMKAKKKRNLITKNKGNNQIIQPHIMGMPTKYGWAKVTDYGLDRAEPTPLGVGDYVLFSKGPKVQDNDMVIIPQLINNQGNQYSIIIRRYKENNIFAESSKKGVRYRSITLGEDIPILGVVIAIAKRCFPLTEKNLYKILLGRLGGNEKKAEELVKAELKLNPVINKTQLLINTILRWDLNN
jgi:hypothetical protein